VASKYEIQPSCQIAHDVLQKLYLEEFGYRNYGTFVEVGAWDGVQFSNTWGLAHAGWHGLFVEPSPSFAETCRRNHSEHSVEVECCAAGQGNGECDLWLGGSVSSMIESHARAWGIPREQKARVQLRTMDWILGKHNWPATYDLLVVDVEGAEESVLRGYSMQRWRPHMAIIEAHEGCHGSPYCDAFGHNRTVEFCAGYFRTHHYTKVYHDMLNTIWVSSKNRPVA